MPSVLKARAGKPSVAEMRAELNQLRKPTARTLEVLLEKYRNLCLDSNPIKKEIEVREPGINWKALVMSLPPPHNKDVLGCGIRKVFVRETECVYEGMYRFHIERLDGSKVPFEFRDAYDDAYHHYKDKSFKDDVETALRAAILPHLIAFKEMKMKDGQAELVCEISGVVLPWEKAAVQHFPSSFKLLLDSFLNEMQLKIEDIKIERDGGHGYRIKDPDLLQRWQIYHRSHGVFRIISTDEAMERTQEGL